MINRVESIVKKKDIKKIIVVSIIFILIIIGLVIGLMMSSSKSKNEIDSSNKKYALSELEFLKEINTNEIFTFLDDSVNSELKGTYAFLKKKKHF